MKQWLTSGIFVMLRKYRLGCVLGCMVLFGVMFPVQAAQIGELQFEHAKGKLKNSLMLAKMSVDGHERRFSVILPKGYDPSKSYPVVFRFHGAILNNKLCALYSPSFCVPPNLKLLQNSGFIVVSMSSYSQSKRERLRGTWLWHAAFSNREDFVFVHHAIKKLIASKVVNIDKNKMFARGHSSGGLFLYSFVLGGPHDLRGVHLQDTYHFRGISVSGASLRKGIIDFDSATPKMLPSLLHVQGEKDTSLWFNGTEKAKRRLNFAKYSKSCPNTRFMSNGLRETRNGLVYSVWNENHPNQPSALLKWAKHMGLSYQGYNDRGAYYVYHFSKTGDMSRHLLGVRLKNCGHIGFDAVPMQLAFFKSLIGGANSKDYFESQLKNGALLKCDRQVDDSKQCPNK